jgi:transketolase
MAVTDDERTVELERVARRLRGRLVAMSHRAQAPHLASALSCVDILVAAYWTALRIDPQQPGDPQRDRFILSKGHAGAALYAVLAERGFFPQEWLDQYGEAGGRLPEQLSPGCVPGVEAATGSLGHGLSLGVGMALAARIQQRDYRVWVVLSDGECNEGAVWEAALFAAAQRVGHLAVVIDYNRWQATGRSNEVMALQPLADKWTAFGWRAREVDGHNLAELAAAMQPPPAGTDRPLCLVAHTVKGRGVSFMEDNNDWHYRIPTADQVQAARSELQLT